MARRTRRPRGPTGDYEVGYGKPPIETRFPHQVVRRKSQKRPKSLIEHFEEILDGTLQVQGRDGTVGRVNVRKRLAMTFVDKALKGDRQVFLALVKLLAPAPRKADRDVPEAATEIDTDDEALIAAFLAGQKASRGEEGA